MKKLSSLIVKKRVMILIISLVLLIPSVIGYISTKVNYDLLTYLPEEIDTMKGQDILKDDFGTGAFSLLVAENMKPKEITDLKEKIEKTDHVKDVIWYDSLLDASVPMEMLPKDLYEAFNHGDATMLMILYDDTSSADGTMDAVREIRKITDERAFLSGMTAVLVDTQALSEAEAPLYVLMAVILSCQYRHGNHLQSRIESVPRTDLLCHKGTGCGAAAGCYDGLLHLPVAQLRELRII